MDCKNPNSATCADGAQSPENSIDVDALNDRNMLIGLEPMPNNAQFDDEDEDEADLYTPRARFVHVKPESTDGALADSSPNGPHEIKCFSLRTLEDCRKALEDYGEDTEIVGAVARKLFYLAGKLEEQLEDVDEEMDGLIENFAYILDARCHEDETRILNMVTHDLFAASVGLQRAADLIRAYLGTYQHVPKKHEQDIALIMHGKA